MQDELYFDIHSDEVSGSLYRVPGPDGAVSFLHVYSTYDEERDETTVHREHFPSFSAYWQQLTRDREWFYRHPLYVHPEQRDFITAQLNGVNWAVHPDPKWQISHQRQWTKVLTDPGQYYKGPSGARK